MEIPENLRDGEVFKVGAVRKINGILAYLRATRLFGDNRTIRVNRSAAGIVLSAQARTTGTSAGREGYNGMFKVSPRTQNEKVSLEVNGGVIYYNATWVDCPNQKDISLQEGFFCIKARLEGKNSISVEYEIVKRAGSFPVMLSDESNTTAYYPVAKITGSEQNGWKVEQIVRYCIPQLWCFGPCKDEKNE